MTTLQLSKHVNKAARLAQSNGQSIEINYRLPYVDINGTDSVYFIQGEEANNLIEEARNSKLNNYCSVENIILWQSQGW